MYLWDDVYLSAESHNIDFSMLLIDLTVLFFRRLNYENFSDRVEDQAFILCLSDGFATVFELSHRHG